MAERRTAIRHRWSCQQSRPHVTPAFVVALRRAPAFATSSLPNSANAAGEPFPLQPLLRTMQPPVQSRLNFTYN